MFIRLTFADARNVSLAQMNSLDILEFIQRTGEGRRRLNNKLLLPLPPLQLLRTVNLFRYRHQRRKEGKEEEEADNLVRAISM
jgi:hypothetical protein